MLHDQKMGKLSMLATSMAFAPLALSQDPIPVEDGQVVVSGLVLNEVAPGPKMTYVEIINLSDGPVNLDGYSIDSATGSHFLSSLPDSIDQYEFAVIMNGRNDEVGISTAPNVLARIIDQPVCGAVTDTVILRDNLGNVVDAMSYGVSKDTSPRYAEAVLAGEFPDGEFVDVSQSYNELSIGRNRAAADTNQMSDWATDGGPNALVGSPFAPNVAIPSGEDAWVMLFQGFLASTVSHRYYGIDVISGSYSGYVGDQLSSSCVHTMEFNSPIFGFSNVILSGAVQNEFETLPGDQHRISAEGVLSDAQGNSIEFSIERNVTPDEDSTAIVALVSNGFDSYPYEISEGKLFEGVRGDYSQNTNRFLTQWGGNTKSTTASQDVDWTIVNGELSSVDSTGIIIRPFPLYDGEFSLQAPRPVVATETIDIDWTATNVNGAPQLTWNQMDFSYSNSIPDYSLDGVSVSRSVSGATLTDDLDGNFSGAGFSQPFSTDSTFVDISGSKLMQWTEVSALGSLVLTDRDATFDPPMAPVVGFWDKVKSGFKNTVKVAASGVVLGCAGIGCIVTATGAGATGVFASVETLGVASGPAIALAGAGVTACGGMAYGGEKIVDEIWDN